MALLVMALTLGIPAVSDGAKGSTKTGKKSTGKGKTEATTDPEGDDGEDPDGEGDEDDDLDLEVVEVSGEDADAQVDDEPPDSTDADEELTPDGGPSGVSGAPAGEPPVAASTVEQYIELAQKNHPSIEAAKWELESYRKQLDFAHWAPYFNINLSTLLAPMSRMEGNALASKQGEFDISSDMGIWVKVEITAAIPLYTFGKITSYWEMAEQGVKVGESKLEKEKQQIAFDVRRAFFSLQIAREILHVGQDGSKYIDKALVKVEEGLEDDTGSYTESDLMKLKAGKIKLDTQIALAKKIEKLAIAALKFYTGNQDLQPPDEPIEPEVVQVGSLDQYLASAQENRPELKMLGSAVKVNKANVKLKKASMLPNLVLAGQYTFAYANKVQDQNTPFAYDPFNKHAGGVVLMLEWPLDFVPGAYGLGQAKADLFKMEAQQQNAMGGIGVEVELAYQEVVEANERMELLKQGKKIGKGWIIAQSQGFDAGLTEMRDFVDALTTYFEMYMLFYQSVYDYNVALAKLRLVAGTDEIAGKGTAGTDE